MASDVRTPRDQEDRRPLATLAANVLQNARGARAPHIDGTAKLSNKRLRGPRSSDAQKFESMFTTIDRIEALIALAEDVRQYLLSTCSNSNVSRSPQTWLKEALVSELLNPLICTTPSFIRLVPLVKHLANKLAIANGLSFIVVIAVRGTEPKHIGTRL